MKKNLKKLIIINTKEDLRNFRLFYLNHKGFKLNFSDCIFQNKEKNKEILKKFKNS